MIFSSRKTVGVFISKMFRVFDDAFFHALEEESRRLNMDIIVFLTAGFFLTSSDYDLQEKNILQFAPLRKLDGLLVVPGTYEKGDFRDSIYEMLNTKVQCPTVIVREPSERFDSVYTANRKAMVPLLRHLIEDHGLKRICFQGSEYDDLEVAARLDAFREEMAAHDLPVPENAVCLGNMWTNCGETAYQAFFSDPSCPPEAVVCANDYMAMGLIRVLAQKGIRVPEDVIVTGFDNITDWCVDVPSVTSIQPDYNGMVREAMTILDQRIRKANQAEELIRKGLPGSLVLGESCGCGKRDENFFRRICGKAMTALEDENDQDAAMNNMSIDLGACDNLVELHQALISKRTENPIVRDHYLCLLSDGWNHTECACNSDQAVLVHQIRNHQDDGMPMRTFDRSRILPPEAGNPEEPQVFYLKLLHQKGHNFGYSVFHYDPGKIPSRCFVQTNALISIALENIHRRNELIELYEERRRSSITDMLTGLLNRRGLIEHVKPLWDGLLGHSVAFISIDLDHLKKINDAFGHAAGDQALRLVGQAILDALPEDAAGSRIGGDEFVAFLPDADEEAAFAMICSFRKILAQLAARENCAFPISASAGWSVKKLETSDTVESCVEISDRSLYHDKESHHIRLENGNNPDTGI